MNTKLVNVCDVCKEIFAGGDAPKDRFSKTKNELYQIPIFSNGEANKGLYGYTDFFRVDVPSITVSARGTIGYTAIREEPFVPIVRLITLIPRLDVIDIRYLYYAIQNYNFANTGTSIPQLTVPTIKKYCFPLPEMKVQKSIVEKLDEVTNLIENRKEQIQHLDNLVKSRFIEMFSNKEFPICKWKDVFETTTGKLDSNAMVPDGPYPFFTCAKEIFRIDKYAFDQEALLLAGNNAAGKYDVKHYKGKFNAYQRTYVLTLKNSWSYSLFKYQLEDKLTYLQEQSKGSNTRYITLKILGDLEFIIPPIELQNQFASFVEQTDKLKLAAQETLNELEILKKSLMQKYFG